MASKTTRFLSFFNSPDVRAQGGELADQVLVAPLHKVDVLHPGGALGGKTCDHQGCSGTKVVGGDGGTLQVIHTHHRGGLVDDADLEIRPSGEKSDINKNKVQKSSQMEDLKPESYYFEFYKNYRKLIDSLEKLPLKIKQPIEDMIIRLADNLENAVVSFSREAGSEPEKFPVD